jgi:hypothetical protein
MDDSTVRDSVDGVEVSASRKIQLEQYEPIETSTTLTATKPDDVDYDEWVEALSDLAMSEAERAAMARHEEHVREEAFGDD